MLKHFVPGTRAAQYVTIRRDPARDQIYQGAPSLLSPRRTRETYRGNAHRAKLALWRHEAGGLDALHGSGADMHENLRVGQKNGAEESRGATQIRTEIPSSRSSRRTDMPEPHKDRPGRHRRHTHTPAAAAEPHMPARNNHGFANSPVRRSQVPESLPLLLRLQHHRGDHNANGCCNSHVRSCGKAGPSPPSPCHQPAVLPSQPQECFSWESSFSLVGIQPIPSAVNPL